MSGGSNGSNCPVDKDREMPGLLTAFYRLEASQHTMETDLQGIMNMLTKWRRDRIGFDSNWYTLHWNHYESATGGVGEAAMAAVAIGRKSEADDGARIATAGDMGEFAVTEVAIGGRAEVDNEGGYD
ncbi:HMA domain-containing protein [Psidium guajava]|nr:HMA domain-containing protein [Psidium guajava]